MQKDMHFAGTYIVARAAGFDHAEASTVANAAQYVDDATHSGFVRFTSGALFQRTATCHALADPDNLNALQNHLAWLPFHFLPGNEGESDADRLVCRQNSVIAREMVAACVAAAAAPQGLHRLGITAHVLADTFAHKGFAGIIHHVNVAEELTGDDPVVHESILTQTQNLLSRLTARFSDVRVCMLGHGLVHAYPDLPWLSWSYRNGAGQTIHRDNPTDFIDALNALLDLFLRWRKARGDSPASPALSATLTSTLADRLRSTRDEDGDTRCSRWINALAAGEVPGIPPVEVRYDAKEWRSIALETEETFAGATSLEGILAIDCPSGFLRSDWKLFHDAAKDHRYQVTQVILPRHNLCAA